MKANLMIGCLILTTTAFGQKHSVSINYKPSLTYFGKQSQSFSHAYFTSRKGDKTFNHSVNLLYSFKLSSKAGFTTGIEYSQQGQDVNFNADSAFPGQNRTILKIDLNYIRIPLTVNYSLLQKKTSALSLYSGLSLGLAMRRKDNYQNIILENILLPPAEKRYRARDWAIPIGLNYAKQWTSMVFSNLGAEYLIGLTDAFSDNSLARFGVLSEFKNSKQKRLSLNIGLGFQLAK